MKQKSYDTDTLKAIRKSWYSLPPEAVPESKREIYCLRKKAVDMYIDDVKTAEIEKLTGIYPSNLLRHIRKCLVIDNKGEYFGYYALIPGQHCNNKPKNGRFQSLLDK